MSKKLASKQPRHGDRVLTCEHAKIAVGVYKDREGRPQVYTVSGGGDLHWFESDDKQKLHPRPGHKGEFYTYQWFAVCDECFLTARYLGVFEFAADFIHIGDDPFIVEPPKKHQ